MQVKMKVVVHVAGEDSAKDKGAGSSADEYITPPLASGTVTFRTSGARCRFRNGARKALAKPAARELSPHNVRPTKPAQCAAFILVRVPNVKTCFRLPKFGTKEKSCFRIVLLILPMPI